ncbi:MAG TPA: hypothetical protein VE986_06535, partial [Hyphomicrobiales bacterium]|nr:hypothetical protein [Hyphomicrobiales bacterium]
AAHDAAEQAARSANERLTQMQNALANAEQSARDAREALKQAIKEKENAEQAAKAATEALASAKEHSPRVPGHKPGA